MPATDFVHDEEIVEAVLDQLEAGLPESWTKDDSCFLRLKRFGFGDLRDEHRSGNPTWADVCPMLLVRLDRSERAADYGGLGGAEGHRVPLRLIYARARWQCLDTNDPAKVLQPPQARAQYAKIISRALFRNRNLSDPPLTTTDASARVIDLQPRAIVYDADHGDLALATAQHLVALAIDFEVVVRTQ